MRSDIVPGAVFPEYELSDLCGRHLRSRSCSNASRCAGAVPRRVLSDREEATRGTFPTPSRDASGLLPSGDEPYGKTQGQVFDEQEELLVDTRSLVSIVDDDESVRESLPDMLRQFGFAARAFSSSEAFLASDVVSATSCLLLDVAMPGMSGPGLQQELKRRRQEIPIVFITAHSDESARRELLARGAAECLFKPFSEAALLDALNTALRMR